MDSNPPLKKAKVVKASALPTKDEQKNLLQMESLLRSNLLTLQVTELLQQVDGEKILSKKKLSLWLERLNNNILSASVKVKNKESPNELSEKWLSKQKFCGLYMLNDNIKINFSKPTSVDFIGSYAIQTSTAPLLNIDIAITMPSDMFDEKDILNHKYFDKRKLYLAGLAKSLSKIKSETNNEDPEYDISFSWFKGDMRKPILEIDSLFVHSNSKIVIRLIPVLPETVFKLVQLRPQKNNVRPSDWSSRLKANKDKGVKDSALDPSSLPATPLYNMAILEDTVILSHHDIISKTVLPHNSLKDAVVLLKIWATQRFLRYSSDGFDSHDICMLIAYLTQTRRLSTSTDKLAAFQSVLTFLAETDLNTLICDFTSVELMKRDLNSFSDGIGIGQLIHPIAINSDGIATNYNVLWRVSASTLNALREEAKKSLGELQYNQDSCFDHLFMQKKSFFEKHDLFFHFEIDSNLLLNFENTSKDIIIDGISDNYADDDDLQFKIKDDLQRTRLDYNCHQYFSKKAVDIVSKALGDRALTVNSFIRCTQLKKTDNNKFHVENYGSVSNFPKWSLLDNEEESKNSWIISLGVIVDKEKGYRRVERGPSPDDEYEQLEEFRYFWGKDKCQLRRFKDGSIIEAVVWDTGSENSLIKKSDKELIKSDVIIDNVIRHVLGRHLALACGTNGTKVVSCLTSQLESFYYSLITGANKIRQKNIVEVNLDDSDSLSRDAVESLDQLRTILTSKIKNIPLSFESLMAVSPELRYSSVLPPRPQPILVDKETLNEFAGKSISLLTNPLKIFAKLESSGKWPVLGEAILKSKTALLLRTRSELMKQFQIHSVIHRDSLDIFHNGFVFRLLLQTSHDTEYLVLKSDPSLEALKKEDLIKNIIRVNAIPPLHHLAIKSLHSLFPSFSASVKLLAVWVANHHFTGHLCHEAIELIVASVFLNKSSIHPPSSALSGFYQALLCLGNHDWESDPFIVDVSGNNSDITSSVRSEIVDQFRFIRSQKHNNQSNNNNNNNSNSNSSSFNVSMYIVSSSDKLIDYMPSLASRSPEKVVLTMIVAAAQASSKKLLSWISSCVVDDRADARNSQLAEIITSDAVMNNCNVIFQFHKGVLNHSFSKGPLVARLNVFSNLSAADYAVNSLIVRESDSPLNPLQEEFIEKIKNEFQNEAIFFWNGLTGTELGLMWRPKFFIPKKLSILCSKDKVVISDSENSSKDKNVELITVPNTIEIIVQIVENSDGLVVDVLVK